MNQKVMDFFSAVIDSKELTRRMSAIVTDDNAKAMEQVISVARSAGYELTVNDFLCDEPTRPLTDDELDSVVGGRMSEEVFALFNRFLKITRETDPGLFGF